MQVCTAHARAAMLLLTGGLTAACDRFRDQETSEPEASASATADSSRSAARELELELPPGLSALPTLAEWSGVREVMVKGSSALRCETKVVREWFRVACSGRTDSGGAPTTVRLLSGGAPGTHSSTVGGVASLVTPFESGTHVEALFLWTDKSHKLVLDWPAGAPRPAILGAFEGAKSPLDASGAGASRFRDAVCRCERQNPLMRSPLPELACDEVVVNEDCARSYADDCLSYQKCAIGEPGVMPKCLPGHKHISVNTCAKPCSGAGDCAAGEQCAPSPFNSAQKVCQNRG